MDCLELKQQLQTMDSEKVNELVKKYGINEPNKNDRLWKLALYLRSDATPAEHSKGSRSYVYRENVTGAKEYQTHDNGGRPFLVRVDEDGIHIYTHPDEMLTVPVVIKDDITIKEYPYTELVDTIIDYQGYWWGFDPRYNFHGNSILIDINDHEYIFVGDKIYRFDTGKDVIKDYVSPVGNSDVPYPVAFGKNNVYFMLDKVMIPNNKLNTPITVEDAPDLYSEFYGHILQGFTKKDVKKMRGVKIIKERKY